MKVTSVNEYIDTMEEKYQKHLVKIDKEKELCVKYIHEEVERQIEKAFGDEFEVMLSYTFFDRFLKKHLEFSDNEVKLVLEKYQEVGWHIKSKPNDFYHELIFWTKKPSWWERFWA